MLNEIIFIQKPKTYLEKHRGDFIFSVVIYFILALLLWSFILPLYAILFIAIAVLAPNIIYPNYDGWEINSNQLSIQRIPIFKQQESLVIPFDKIHRVTYIERYKNTPNSLKLATVYGVYRLEINKSMFQIAPTLLHLKQSGIKLELAQIDAELEMYLDEKVDSIPLQNKS